MLREYLKSIEMGMCGGSQEMAIYTALKAAGYLTEAAQVPDEV